MKTEKYRSHYENYPPLIKAAIVVLAFVIGLSGFALLAIPILSDVSVILILLSLGILSFQFNWAQRLLMYITAKLADKSFRRKFFTVLTILFVISIAVIVILIKR